MKKISFYIWANNDTKILETEKALSILSKEFDGMNSSELVWYWHGNSERTLLVNVVLDTVDYTQVKRVCDALKNSLVQDAIMVEIVDTNTLFL